MLYGTLNSSILLNGRAEQRSFGRNSEKYNTVNAAKKLQMLLPTPPSAKKQPESAAVADEYDTFAILFPIRIAESIFPLSLVTFKTLAARLSPFSAKFFMRILFTVTRAVSEDEKNAENVERIKKYLEINGAKA